MDVKELRSWKKGETRKFLNIVDRFSGLQTMSQVPNGSGETLRRAYRSTWRKHYGVPIVAVSDSARAIERGVFAQMFERDETEPRTSAGEAHHENSQTERHGGWFEEIFNSK